MTGRTHLAAFTACPEAGVGYPPYVNVSEEFDTHVTITVRGPARAVQTHEGTFPIAGAEGVITLTRREFDQLIEELIASLNRKPS